MKPTTVNSTSVCIPAVTGQQDLLEEKETIEVRFKAVRPYLVRNHCSKSGYKQLILPREGAYTEISFLWFHGFFSQVDRELDHVESTDEYEQPNPVADHVRCGREQSRCAGAECHSVDSETVASELFD